MDPAREATEKTHGWQRNTLHTSVTVLQDVVDAVHIVLNSFPMLSFEMLKILVQ